MSTAIKPTHLKGKDAMERSRNRHHATFERRATRRWVRASKAAYLNSVQ